jgi:F-type H+-transporting ATPase subunit delta
MADNATTTQAGALAQTYARALFELSAETGALADVADELVQLVQLLEANPTLAALFAHHGIATDRRAATLEKIFRGRVHQTTYGFLGVLNAKGRLGYLKEIHTAFELILKEARGEVDVDVYSATPLSSEQARGVSERIGAAIGKTAVVKPHVDPDLIGGLKIRIGDRLIDASVASQLRRIRHDILRRGAAAARAGTGIEEE